MDDQLQAIVIGGGHAGLAVSHELRERGIAHAVFERGRIGESWRSQRWKSFRLNTPGWANTLPGMPFPGDDDGFGGADEVARYLEAYCTAFALPVRTGVAVTAVRSEGSGFVLEADGGPFATQHVVIASGMQNVPRIPTMAAQLSPAIAQMHGAEYRHAGTLPDGRVLVVGAAQSGCQIVEDLLDAGREVLMATGRVTRVPRRYRGHDIVEWLVRSGFWAQRPSDLPDPAMRSLPQPQISGVGGGHTISYQHLARRGVHLLGHLSALDGTRATFDGDLREHVRAADESRARALAMIDAYIAREGITAPPPEMDPADEPARYEEFSDEPTTCDLAAEGVTSVVWCTGFGGDFNWLPRGATLDGAPLHREGIGDLLGLYFVGLPWLARRDSGVIHGTGADATRIASAIAARLDRSESN